MGKQRRSYSAEFKRHALRLLETSVKSASQIERELGIGDAHLHQWKMRLERPPSSPGLSATACATHS